jgi:hypothetical protein
VKINLWVRKIHAFIRVIYYLSFAWYFFWIIDLGNLPATFWNLHELRLVYLNKNKRLNANEQTIRKNNLQIDWINV